MDEAPENVTLAPTPSDHRPKSCCTITGATDLHLLLCAVHEAAHAVVGLAVGHGVDYAEVVTTGEQMGGYVEPSAPPWYPALVRYVEGFAGGPGGVAASPRLRERLDDEQRAYLEQRIAVDLAGPLVHVG
jgi:hypothetical protein